MVFLPLSVCDERSINSSSRRIHRNTCKRAALPASSTTARHCLGIAQLLHSPNVGPAASRTPSNPLSFIVRRSPLALLKPSGWMERECGDEYRVYQQVYLSLPGSTSPRPTPRLGSLFISAQTKPTLHTIWSHLIYYYCDKGASCCRPTPALTSFVNYDRFTTTQHNAQSVPLTSGNRSGGVLIVRTNKSMPLIRPVIRFASSLNGLRDRDRPPSTEPSAVMYTMVSCIAFVRVPFFMA